MSDSGGANTDSLEDRAGAFNEKTWQDLEKQALSRLERARRQKTRNELNLDIREAYFFTAPQRSRNQSSSVQAGSLSNTSQRSSQAVSELQISLGIECNTDFSTEVISAFMPTTLEWVKQKAGVVLAIDETRKEDLEREIEVQTRIIIDAIKASNFYPAIAQSYKPDLGIGTAAIWIDMDNPWSPFQCLPVPIRFIEINLGPDGRVDDRFFCQPTKLRYVNAVLGALLNDARIPPELQRKIDNANEEDTLVVRGFWRDWKDQSDIAWNYIILIDGKLVFHRTLKGEGSCPLIITRFNPNVESPFGEGPTLQALPDLRMLDVMEESKVQETDLRLSPPVFYPDDGVIDVTKGIYPGRWYPMRPGSGDQIHQLQIAGDVGFAAYALAEREARVRRMHFVDYPQQLGKTPPTAQQWLDEMIMMQRRIGTPGLIYWEEGPKEYFLRFKYILEKIGVITPVKANGIAVSLTPYNPTEAAQDNQDVAVAGRLLQLARENFPQTAELIIDQAATIRHLQEKMSDTIVVVRSDDEVQAAAAQMVGGNQQISGGPGAGQIPISPGGAGQGLLPQ